MSVFAKYPLLLASAIAHGLLSVGHTTKGLEQFKHPSLNQLPSALRGAAKTGWYEGSVFFAILGLLNYKWARTGLVDGADKAIASLQTTLLFGAGLSYYRAGDKATALILSLVGVLQGLGARGAAL